MTPVSIDMVDGRTFYWMMLNSLWQWTGLSARPAVGRHVRNTVTRSWCSPNNCQWLVKLWVTVAWRRSISSELLYRQLPTSNKYSLVTNKRHEHLALRGNGRIETDRQTDRHGQIALYSVTGVYVTCWNKAGWWAALRHTRGNVERDETTRHGTELSYSPLVHQNRWLKNFHSLFILELGQHQ